MHQILVLSTTPFERYLVNHFTITASKTVDDFDGVPLPTNAIACTSKVVIEPIRSSAFIVRKLAEEIINDKLYHEKYKYVYLRELLNS